MITNFIRKIMDSPLQEENQNEEAGELVETTTESSEKADPLKNPLILEHIFMYLPLEDIKSCRRVCKQWHELSTPLMEKMSAIPLYPDTLTLAPVETRSPKEYKEFCKTSGIFVSAFRLKSRLDDPAKWSFQSLKRFFEQHKEIMTELNIDNINIAAIWRVGRCREEIYYFDANSLQIRSDHKYFSLDPHIGNGLTHLAIDNSNGSKFILSTEKLTATKTLSLRFCALQMSDQCQLSPEKLELCRVGIMKDEAMFDTFVVDDLINFQRLKELTLDGTTIFQHSWCMYHYKTSKLAIAKNKFTLKNLFLKSVKIENFENAQWEINGTFKLRNVPFENWNRMHFTEMDFGGSVINLSVLPLSLEKLTLSKLECESTAITLNRSSPLTLPELKFLQIFTLSTPYCSLCRFKTESKPDFDEGEVHYEENFLHNLKSFAHCKNLTTLKITCHCHLDSEDLCFSTSWIPEATEHLTLIGHIRAVGTTIKIKTLVLQNDNLENLDSCLKKVQCDHLILDLDYKEMEPSDLDDFIVSIIKKPYQTLAIGALTTNTKIFQKSTFSHFVDSMADYYLFEKRRGRAIELWQFEKLKEE